MTHANDQRPLARILTGYQGQEFVVELTARRITVRPKGARRGGPNERSITPSALLDYLILRG